MLERPSPSADTPRRFSDDVNGTHLANAVVAFVFAASGPVAIILAAGTKGGLSQSDLSSWIFGAFFINGLVTIAYSLYYKQPLAFFWTIPGTVLVGPALEHLSFEQVIGAFYATGVLMMVLGFSGWVRRAMQAVPMPIVMGMVAGVFLQFGLDWVHAFENGFLVAAAMTAAFVLATLLPGLGRFLPPLIAALATGIAVLVLTDGFAADAQFALAVASPNLYQPSFSWQAMFELVVPLAITVLVVQNGQGFAILRSADHEPPINAVTVACGGASIVGAVFGTVSTCLTGPTNAILVSSGEKSGHYTGGVVVGLLALVFGLFSPVFTSFMLSTPKAFIATLAGLAMLKVLQGAFTAAFKERFALSALITFLVTVSDLSLFNIGAPFWGLVFGFAASWLLERHDYQDTGGS